MPSSKHLAQSAHDELFKFFVSGGAGKALGWIAAMQEGTINLARRKLMKEG